jgi:Yip1 domain
MFKQLFLDTKNVIIHPGKYFAEMTATSGVLYPIIKTAVYFFATRLIFAIYWTLTSPTQYHNFSQMTDFLFFKFAPNLKQFIFPFFALFVLGEFIWILAALLKGKRNYLATLRISASITVIYFAFAAFKFLLHTVDSLLYVHVYIAAVISIFYAFVLMYFGLTKTLETKQMKTLILLSSMTLLVLIFSYNIFLTDFLRGYFIWPFWSFF